MEWHTRKKGKGGELNARQTKISPLSGGGKQLEYKTQMFGAYNLSVGGLWQRTAYLSDSSLTESYTLVRKKERKSLRGRRLGCNKPSTLWGFASKGTTTTSEDQFSKWVLKRNVGSSGEGMRPSPETDKETTVGETPALQVKEEGMHP